MDKSKFEGNMDIMDREIEALLQALDVVDPAKEEYGIISKNLKTVLDCKAIEARNALEVEKLEEEQRQFDLKREKDDADFDAKLELERDKNLAELELAREKLEVEKQQADKRHQHDLSELEEEKRHNLVDEAQKAAAERNRNLITGGGILLTTALAGVIYAGECKGAVIGSGATSILKLVRLF